MNVETASILFNKVVTAEVPNEKSSSSAADVIDVRIDENPNARLGSAEYIKWAFELLTFKLHFKPLLLGVCKMAPLTLHAVA